VRDVVPALIDGFKRVAATDLPTGHLPRILPAPHCGSID